METSRQRKRTAARALTLGALLATSCAAGTGDRGLAPPEGTPADLVDGWEHLNGIRRAADLEPVRLDAELSAGADLHVRYLELNVGRPEVEGLRAHEEVPGLPGFTEEGARAGRQSDLAFQEESASSAVDTWVASLYHRTPILSRRLRAVGIGAGRTGTYALRFRFDDDAPAGPPVAYPYDGQPDAPRLFSRSWETPEPRPASWRGASWGESVLYRTGFPVTLAFDRRDRVAGARAALGTEEGEPVEAAFSSPDAPALAFPQGNVVALLPRAPLAPGHRYSVEVEAVVNGAPRRVAWSFSTAPPAPVDLDGLRSLEGLGGTVAFEGRVATAHRMVLGSESTPEGCVGVLVLGLEPRAGGALRVEVDVPEALAEGRPLLGLVGAAVRVEGELDVISPSSARVQLETMASLAVLADDLPEIDGADPAAVSAHDDDIVWVRGTLGAPLPREPGAASFLPLDPAGELYLSLSEETLEALARREGLASPALEGLRVRVRGRVGRMGPRLGSRAVYVSHEAQVERLAATAP